MVQVCSAAFSGLVLAAMLASGAAKAAQLDIEAALSTTRTAQVKLETAEHDKGEHRALAIRHVEMGTWAGAR